MGDLKGTSASQMTGFVAANFAMVVFPALGYLTIELLTNTVTQACAEVLGSELDAMKEGGVTDSWNCMGKAAVAHQWLGASEEHPCSLP